MATKVAINGFGRIGRAVARILMAREDMELVNMIPFLVPMPVPLKAKTMQS
jgi:glyceraldehyde-3-phosphate dehydrogenase/erythrose-4-phosphate dehydrogenase